MNTDIQTGFRGQLKRWIESPLIRNGILVVIVINAIVLGLETSKTVEAMFGGLLSAIDAVCLWIFVAELVAKLMTQAWPFWQQFVEQPQGSPIYTAGQILLTTEILIEKLDN